MGKLYSMLGNEITVLVLVKKLDESAYLVMFPTYQILCIKIAVLKINTSGSIFPNLTSGAV